MKTVARTLVGLLLLGTSTLVAQPELRIAISNEFGFASDYVTGPAGSTPIGALSVFEVSESAYLLATRTVAPDLGETRRMLSFRLLIGNYGDEPWDPMNMPVTFDRFGFFALDGFAEASILDTSGNVLHSTLIATPFAYDQLPVVPLPSSGFNHVRFGLSPGWAMFDDWQGVEITDLPNGDYFLQLTVDPLGFWNQFSQVLIPFQLQGFNARIRRDSQIPAAGPVDRPIPNIPRGRPANLR